jgi:hypothetical protein
MDCLTFRRQHLEFLDQALLSDFAAEMEAHTAACERCDRFDRAVRRGLLVAWNLTRLEPRPDFLARLHSRIRVPAPPSSHLAVG